jgi:hypothetical protein
VCLPELEEPAEVLATIREFLDSQNKYQKHWGQQREAEGSGDIATLDIQAIMKKKQDEFLKKKAEEDTVKNKSAGALEEEKKESIRGGGGSVEDDLDFIIKDSTELKKIESKHEELEL